LLHLVDCSHCCSNEARSHKHQAQTVSQDLRVSLRKFIAWLQQGKCKIVELNNVTSPDHNNMNRLQATAVFSHFPFCVFCLLHFTRIDWLEVSRVPVELAAHTTLNSVDASNRFQNTELL